jgi:exopolysaccharide biosynthesis polyprenyl glycosylphosphotransferase
VYGDRERAFRRELQALRKSRTAGVEAKSRRESRQRINPARQISRLMPNLLVGDSERSGEILERSTVVHTVLRGMKCNVEGSRRDPKDLDFDPADGKRVRVRRQLVPNRLGRGEGADQRAMEVNVGTIGGAHPLLRVGVPPVVHKRAKAELANDILGMPVCRGCDEKVGVDVWTSRTVPIKPGRGRGPFEEQGPDSGRAHRPNDLARDAVNMKDERGASNRGKVRRHGWGGRSADGAPPYRSRISPRWQATAPATVIGIIRHTAAAWEEQMSPDNHPSSRRQRPDPEALLAGRGPMTVPATPEHSAAPADSALGTLSTRRKGLMPERAQLALDVVMLGAAMIAVVLTASAADDPVESPVWLVALPLFVLALVALHGMYGPRLGARFLDDAGYIAAATALAVMAITLARILFTTEDVPGSQPLREWFFAAACLIAGHAAMTLTKTRAQRRHGGGRPTLIIGAGRVGHLLAKRLLARPELGLRPIGFLDGPARNVREGWAVPVLGDISKLEHAVFEHEVEHAIISFSRLSPKTELESLQRLEQLGVSVSIVPRLFEALPDRVVLERVGAMPLVSIYPSIAQGWQKIAIKYAFDRAVAALAILLLAPLLAAAAAGIMVSVGRPVLFRQRRVGLDRREFDMFKFRTMRDQPDDRSSLESGWKAFAQGLGPGGVEGADRRTRFGAFLRRTSLDELPQLFNVLRGEMSIVGPRPERPEYVRAFEKRVHRYDLRHRVKAGITGWAQVHGLRGRTPLADRVEYDNYYIENWSLWLDVKVLLLTVLAVFRGRSE